MAGAIGVHLLVAALLLVHPGLQPTVIDPVVVVTLPQEMPASAAPNVTAAPPARPVETRSVPRRALPPTRIDKPVPAPTKTAPRPAHQPETAQQVPHDTPPPAASASATASGDRPARYVPGLAVNTPPIYPTLARRRGEQGPVVFEVRVRPDGSAGEVVLIRTSGFPSLDEAALHAVRDWHFVPAHKGGTAAEGQVKVTVVFRLTS